MNRCRPILVVVAALAGAGATGPTGGFAESAAAWRRHTIDASSRGADGVRPLDVNGDGLPDLVTGWEEGGLIRIALHPGPDRVREPWPAATVGRVPSPEDAVFVDLDGDGRADVVSCCEGRTRSVFVHWSPRAAERLLEESAWTTAPFPALEGRQMWMFCLPWQVDGERGVDLVLGSKGDGAEIGWLESPDDPRDLAAWRWHPLSRAGWVMSLLACDLDGDGDLDLLCTDRKGPKRGCRWLENPGPDAVRRGEVWPEHLIGGAQQEVMFAARGDLDGDGVEEIAAATSDGGVLLFRRRDSAGRAWETTVVPMPPGCGTGKGVAIGDLDLDGRADLAVTCEHAAGKHGVFWLSAPAEVGGPWRFHPISGEREGVKFDLIQLLDLDGDGDLDLLTCEERDNLGVVWYENPARSPR